MICLAYLAFKIALTDHFVILIEAYCTNKGFTEAIS
jgi:hypothetical protein